MQNRWILEDGFGVRSPNQGYFGKAFRMVVIDRVIAGYHCVGDLRVRIFGMRHIPFFNFNQPQKPVLFLIESDSGHINIEMNLVERI